MKQARSFLFAVALTTIGWPVTSTAQSGGHGAKRRAHGSQNHRPGGPLLNAPLERMAERLALTPKQVAALRDIRQKFDRETRDYWKAAQAAKDQLQANWRSADIPDKATILRLINERHTNRVQGVHRMVDARIAAMKVLTAEQRGKLAGFRPGRSGPKHGRRR